jgi:plasmid stabilization system protein ParE
MDTGTYKIIWSSEANQNLANILNYLLITWNGKVANDFLENIDKKLITISYQPFIGTVSEKDESVRSILLSKHNRLYYSIYNNTIELLCILDTRQNPSKNSY